MDIFDETVDKNKAMDMETRDQVGGTKGLLVMNPETTIMLVVPVFVVLMYQRFKV